MIGRSDNHEMAGCSRDRFGTVRRTARGAASRVRRAFTLIELLVVIAIIALLISILLPSLSGARDSARDLICKTNMKQIGYAIQMYLDAQKDPVWPNLQFGAVPTADRPSELQTAPGAQVITGPLWYCSWYMGYALEEYLGDNLRSAVYKCPRASGLTSVKDRSVRQYLQGGYRLFLDPADPDYTTSAATTSDTVRRYTEYWFNDNGYVKGGRLTNRPMRVVKYPDEMVWIADAYDEVPRHSGKTRTQRGNEPGNEVVKRSNRIYMLRGDLRITEETFATANDGRDRYGTLGPFYNWGGIPSSGD